MSYLVDITSVVPEHAISGDQFLRFYSQACNLNTDAAFIQKLKYLSRKTKINQRYSCVSDYSGSAFELYSNENYIQSIEKRMSLFKEKIMPLSIAAIDSLIKRTAITTGEITHLITVSCTGLFAPGIEFMLSEHYGLHHAEKSALNFLGCYAALKALKQAWYITQADPKANVLILSAELCSLHFSATDKEEDMIPNLLFGDGAAAALICGSESPYTKGKILLRIDQIGSACIPDSSALMTWELNSSLFRMFLGKQIAEVLKSNIQHVISDFSGEDPAQTAFWAIHPGGIKIVEGIQEKLALTPSQVEDSLHVLEQYGNMSSPTILFILNRIFEKIRKSSGLQAEKIIACAFGPGIHVELIRLSSSVPAHPGQPLINTKEYVVQD